MYQVRLQLNELAKVTKHNRNVRVIRCWHGTDYSMTPKITDTGFAAIAKMDAGWFGKGTFKKRRK